MNTTAEPHASKADPAAHDPPPARSASSETLPITDLKYLDVPQLEGYEIVGKLGSGGMGVVWRARQLSTHREVALKFMSLSAMGSEKARRRFDREVEVASKLEHPCIARVYDSGIQRGQYYYAMELVDGVPLDSFVKKQDLRQPQILSLFATICHAIQHAHLRGIIHRDLKPSNIMIDAQGSPHVLDFGLGKLVDAPAPIDTITLPEEWAGTPAFMSPEQAGGKNDEIDTRSDVYSLGVNLFLLLTGQYPHDISGSNLSVLNRVVEEEVKRPRKAAKGIDGELEALLLKALAKRPDDRYPSAGSLGEDIDNYLNGEPLTARHPTAFYFLRKKAKKYRVPLTAVAIGLTCLLAVSVLGSVQVARQRDRAIAAANQERTGRQITELKVADGLTAWADLLTSDGQWHEAREKLQKAAAIQTAQNITPTAANAILLDCDRHDPAPLVEWHIDGEAHSNNRLNLWFNQDGQTITMQAADGRIATYDLLTGQVFQVIGAALSKARICSSVFSAGQLIRVVESEPDGQFRVETLDVSSGKVLRTRQLPPKLQKMMLPKLSPDGHHAAFLQGAWARRKAPALQLAVLNLENDSAPQVVCPANAEAFNAVYASDSERLFVSGADGPLSVVDPATGAVIQTYRNGTTATSHGGIARMIPASDGSGVLWDDGNEDFGFISFDAEKGPRLFNSFANTPRALTVSPTGTIAAVGDVSGIIRLISIATGETLGTVAAHDMVVGAQFSQNGKLLATQSLDGYVQIWPVDVSPEPAFATTAASAICMAISPDGHLAADSTNDGHVEIWDVSARKILRVFALRLVLTSIIFSNDGTTAIASSIDGQVVRCGVFDGRQSVTCAPGTALSVLPNAPLKLSGVLFLKSILSPDGDSYVALTQSGTELVDAAHGVPIRTLDLDCNVDACFTPDGLTGLLLTSGPRPPALKVFEPDKGVIKEIPVTAPITSIAISPDARVAYAGTLNGWIWAINLDTKETIWKVMANRKAVRCLNISTDGALLLSHGTEGTVRLWDAVEGRQIHTMTRDLTSVAAVLSHDGKTIWCDDGRNHSYLWDLTLPDRIDAAINASTIARATLAKHPDDANARDALLNFYLLRGQTDLAMHLLPTRSGGTTATINSARCRWEMGDLAGAATDFDALAAKESDPSNKEYLQLCRGACSGKTQ